MAQDGYSVKGQIQDAFMELLSEKAYTDITVTEIVKKAQVARVSYYRNFSSIDEIVDSIADGMVKEFASETLPVLKSNDERKWRQFLFHYFYQFSKNQKNFSAERFRNMSIIFTRINDKMNAFEKNNPDKSVKGKYGSVGKMGLISSIVRKWMDEGMKETPEEMIDYIMSFITSF